MTQKVWYLQQIELFQGIPKEEIMEIAKKVIEKHCSKKELIYTPFEANDQVCVLKKGEVTLYHSHHGKRIIIDVLKPGAIFGNISFEAEGNDHFAEVTEDAFICFFNMEDFMKVLQAKPEVMMKFFKLMSERIADYEQKIKGGVLDSKEKVLHHLELLQKKREHGIIGKIIGPRTKITHEKLAQHTGLSRETVTRAINALKKEGRIEISENGDIITHEASI